MILQSHECAGCELAGEEEGDGWSTRYAVSDDSPARSRNEALGWAIGEALVMSQASRKSEIVAHVLKVLDEAGQLADDDLDARITKLGRELCVKAEAILDLWKEFDKAAERKRHASANP